VAEIPIQRKEGRNIWPLLIGLLVIVAVVWFVFARPGTSNTAAARADSAAVASPAGVTRDSAGGTTTGGAPAATTPATTTPRTDSTTRP
jgi:hypothetical protein